jgi:HAE1 family hydrophobic/amphiphilic exporter-1
MINYGVLMNFFINRPIFAAAIALIMILAGGVCIFVLPVAQYPPLVPPQVQVTTQYIGASSKVVADTVTTPLEESINGAPGMIYMSSSSTNNGDCTIDITFETGYDQDIGQMDVMNRCSQAMAELPDNVKQVGLTINKYSSNMLLAINLISPNGTYDARFLQNYADIHITDVLSRIPGVASITNFGLSKYAMRIWLDPYKLNNLGLTAAEVMGALKEQNQQVAAGKLGQAPAPKNQVYQYQLNTLGRLKQVKQFADIIIKANPNGSVVRIRDIGKVELGGEEYDWDTKLDGKSTATLVVFLLANANGLQVKKNVVHAMKQLEKNFPGDVTWEMCYDTTKFIDASIRDVIITLLVAIALVILVIYLFLQSFRTTVIPAIAVPVALIGTFVFMKILGFSINTLSLLGMVLAVALVVDDAIVVVENVSRRLEISPGKSIREITAEALCEVRGPIIATTLVLMAVFVPIAFIPGMTGMLYNQFSLTIAISVGLSGINSLTLSPALCAVFMKDRTRQPILPFRIFNRFFNWLSNAYAACVKVLIKCWPFTIAAFAGLCVIGTLLLLRTPTAFVPEEDQGYFLVMAELPEGQTIARTKEVTGKISDIARKLPGVAHVLEVSGYNIIDSVKQPNTGFAFVILKPWGERTTPETGLDAIMARLRNEISQIPDALTMVSNAPAIPGLGSTGGFTFEIQDLNGEGIEALSKVSENFVELANKSPELTGVYTTFNMNTPQKYLDIDRLKVKTMQISLNDLFATLQINLGSLYVNNFNKFGRIYRVYLQAMKEARSKARDIGRLKVRNAKGIMVDVSTLVNIKPMLGPYNVPHYNEYNAIAVNGASATGYSSGQAIKAMERLAKDVLPEGFGYQWTNITYQQLKAGNIAPFIFALSLIFVFLVLAAQYESWTMPVMVLLGVPLGLLGAVLSLWLRQMDLNVYAQIGLVMLIGLTAKNGILIVEFASSLRKQGHSIMDAALNAAKIRLRPILMTALAFIIGLIPLVIATGAGAQARQSLGTTVVGGLLIATILIIFIPVFYYTIQKLREMRRGEKNNEN